MSTNRLLRPRLTFAVAALALGLIAAPGCKKKGKGSRGPGALTEEQVQAQVDKAKKEAKVSSLIDFANKDLENGRFMSASKRAEDALKENPDDADAHAVLGAATWRAGDFERSTAAYRKSLELEPKNFGAALGLARNLQAVGAHQEAAEIADKLIAEDKEQVSPYLAKLWSLYAIADADGSVKVLDELFQRMPKDDPLLPLVQSYAAFMRPLAGKGPLCQVSGSSGKSDANIDYATGVKYTGAVVGEEFTRAILFEMREESMIDSKLAKDLKLKEIGKFKPPGQDTELPIVIVPEIKFGDLALKNVPAMVQSLAPYEQSMGERPGLMLGRQALQALGSITYDFPNSNLIVTKDAPASPPDGSAEAPLLLVSMHVQHAPAIPIKIDGSEHSFFVYFGGVYRAGVGVTKKHYLKSGHLPREIDPVDEPEQGFKYVYIKDLALGGDNLGGMGGLVFTNTPADVNLGMILENTAFELGGYINLATISHWKVTYMFNAGKVYIDTSAAG